MLVARILILASATAGEIGTGGRDAMRRRLDDRHGLGAGEAWLFLRNRGFDFFSGENEGNEYGFAASAVVGRETSESVAAVDELFDV
jgi:hypothetical protein